MIEMLRALGSGTEWARWCGEKGDNGLIDRTKYKLFKVDALTDRQKRYDTTISNLITEAGNVALITSYSFDFKLDDYVMYRNEWYKVKTINYKIDDRYLLAMQDFNPAMYQDTVLELMRSS